MILDQLGKHMEQLQRAITEAQRTLGAFETVTAYISHQSNGHSRRQSVTSPQQKQLTTPSQSLQPGFWEAEVIRTLEAGPAAAAPIWKAIAERHPNLPKRKRNSFYQWLSVAASRGQLLTRAGGIGGKYSLTAKAPVKSRGKRAKSPVKRATPFAWTPAVFAVLKNQQPLSAVRISV